MKRSIFILFIVITLFISLIFLLEFLPLENFGVLKGTLNTIFLAFLTSSIFYFVTVTFKKIRDRKNLLPFVSEALLMVVIRERYFYNRLRKEVENDLNEGNDLEKIPEQIDNIFANLTDLNKKVDGDTLSLNPFII